MPITTPSITRNDKDPNMDTDKSPNGAKPSDKSLIKRTALWYSGACLMYLILTLTAGEVENFRYLIPEITANPIILLIALVMSSLAALVLPLVHFGIFAMFKSKRNKETFLYILGGWSITLGFLILVFLVSQLF
jgi:phosphotransferase system  glucose/maltose/N-acetylglucosamine-specific IIC component